METITRTANEGTKERYGYYYRTSHEQEDTIMGKIHGIIWESLDTLIGNHKSIQKQP